jgi:5-hydroxyisourate hydrolase-like protein (transthyretin family)
VLLPDRGPAGTLRGRLVDLVSGAPIGYCDVVAIWRPAGAAPSLLGTQTSDADGRFEFVDLPVGAIELSIHADSLGGQGRGSPIADPSSLWGPALWRARVEADRETTVEIALPPVRPGLIGRSRSLATLPLDALVTDAATGAPIPDATVELFALRTDGEVFAGSAVTRSDGRVACDVFAAERYRVSVTTPWGPGPSAPKFIGKDLELAPQAGRLRVEVALSKR